MKIIEHIARIDQAIFEAEEEMENGAKAIEAEEAFAKLDAKYYGLVQGKVVLQRRINRYL